MYRIALCFKLMSVNRIASGRKEAERFICTVGRIRLFIPCAERDGGFFDFALVVIFTEPVIEKYVDIDFRRPRRCRSDNRAVLSLICLIF